MISVITVTFNAGKVIDTTLKSLKSQKFKDFEHIIIDGKSKDDTIEKIRKASIDKSQIISEPDKGLYDAMNKGLKLAKGKYVVFLNAGDAFHDSETLSRYAQEAHSDPDIIYGDTIIVDSTGNKVADRHLSVPETLTKDSFSSGMLICHQAFMVKKDLTEEYDLKYRFSADFDWCVKCINKSVPEKCVNLKTVTIDYLQDGMTDKNKWKSLRERFNVMAAHYGLPKTIYKHLSFISRALKRGRI